MRDEDARIKANREKVNPYSVNNGPGSPGHWDLVDVQFLFVTTPRDQIPASRRFMVGCAGGLLEGGARTPLRWFISDRWELIDDQECDSSPECTRVMDQLNGKTERTSLSPEQRAMLEMFGGDKT